MASLPPSRSSRKPSSSASTPAAIVASSPIVIGGCGVSAMQMRPARSAQSSHCASRSPSRFARAACRSASPTAGSRDTESPSARSSRGVLRPEAAFAARRSTSRTPSSAVRSASRASISVAKQPNASNRSSIAARSVSGASNHWRNRRAPIGVRVRSNTESTVPAPPIASAPPRRDSTSSRLRRVISSSGIAPPGRSMIGRARCGTPLGCRSRKYRSKAPAAPMASASPSFSPRPSSESTP